MTREEAEKELCRLLEEAEADIQAGRTVPAEEVFAQLREAFAPRNIVYLTGDTHGRFERIVDFCSRREMDRENTFVILGDAGLNFYGGHRDALGKEQLAKLPCTFFCIHGNHEQRPGPELGYELSHYHGGSVWVQPQYPNIVFAIDGEVYDFCGHSCLVIGGAYSVDKYYRLARGYGWWPDEQPSPQIKEKVERVLEERNWQVDVVFSHTCPLKYEPVEVFLPGVDQSTVDKSTEEWLDTIESKLHYERWYCGHYHTEKQVDKLRFMFEDYALLPHTLSIEEEKALIAKMERQAEMMEALGWDEEDI